MTLNPVDTATYQVHMREGTYPLTQSPFSILISDPSDVFNQIYSQGVNRNPTGWSDARLDEIIDAQAREVDTEKRQALFEEAVEILRKGKDMPYPSCGGKPAASWTTGYRISISPPRRRSSTSGTTSGGTPTRPAPSRVAVRSSHNRMK